MKNKLYRDFNGNLIVSNSILIDGTWTEVKESDPEFISLLKNEVKTDVDKITGDLILEKYPIYKQLNIQSDYSSYIINNPDIKTKNMFDTVNKTRKLDYDKLFKKCKKQEGKDFSLEVFNYFYMVKFIDFLRKENNKYIASLDKMNCDELQSTIHEESFLGSIHPIGT